MAQQGQKLRSALTVDPQASRQLQAGQARQLPASTFRKVTAPPPQNVAPLPRTMPGQKPPVNAGPLTPKPSPFDIMGGPAQRITPGQVAQPVDNRVGIGQFEQNQFQPLPVDKSMLQPYPSGQLGIGQFEQNQFQPQVPTSVQLQPGYTGGMLSSGANGVQIPYVQQPESNYGGILRTAQQSPAMNQAAQIAQGAMTGVNPAFRRY